MQFLYEIFENLKKKVYGGSHMQHISNGFYCVTLRSPSKMEILMEGAGDCNFSLTILKENCLFLQLPINFSHTIDARIEKHA